MDAWCDSEGRRPLVFLMWAHWTDGIHPGYRSVAAQVATADAVKLHDYAAHLFSSQVFAFNLFLPFRDGGRARLSECVGSIERVPPGALLGELDGDRPVGNEPRPKTVGW